MENIKGKSFLFDQYGNLNAFCMHLNNLDQLCYYELQKVSTLDPWLFFCDDINMNFLIYDTRNIMYPNSLGIRGDHMETKSHIITNNYFYNIHKKLQEDNSILLSTDFRYVPEFVNCSSDGGEEHYTYFIGEKGEFYFLIERPEYLKNFDQLILAQNKGVVHVRKDHFLEAFNQMCCIKTIKFIDLPDSLEKEIDYLYRVFFEICQNYEKKDMGYDALHKFRTIISNKCYDVLDNFVGFQMLLSRHVILKKCVYNYRKHIVDSNEMVELLDLSILYLRKLKDYSKDYVYHKYIPSCEIIKFVELFTNNEEKLYGYMQAACKKCFACI